MCVVESVRETSKHARTLTNNCEQEDRLPAVRKKVRATGGAVYTKRCRKLYLCNSAGSH